MMNIAIIGTRGIPNHYGGFEGFAEKLSVLMAKKGHRVSVFNSSSHTYQKAEFNGVEIIHCYDPENQIGTAGQFIYDFNCIRECRKRNFDVILQLGYTSSSIWSFLFPKNAAVITNMDGLEWKRDKYSSPVKRFLKQAEKWAVNNSQQLVADNTGIQKYLEDTYQVPSTFIPYGAEILKSPDQGILKEFSVYPYQYNLLIARMEPENNIETIIRAHLAAKGQNPLLIVGNIENKFSQALKNKYASVQIIFLNGIYDKMKLNNLRWYSNLYFHGHSVGGTNPSLLEAMASSALICAHNNIFNQSVLRANAFYFSNEGDICTLLKQDIRKETYANFLSTNMKTIEAHYNWNKIVGDYETLFLKFAGEHR